MYLGKRFSVIMADCFLLPIKGLFVVVEIDQYWVGLFILVFSYFQMSDSSILWCIIEDFVGFDYYMPCLPGAFSGTTSHLKIRKLSLMSPPQNVQ